MDKNEIKQLQHYEYFLAVLSSNINEIFEEQKEYICCANGCCGCCSQGMYPYSELEFKYLKRGFDSLPEETKAQVIKNAKETSKEYKGKHFMYRCPFLINGSCSVYLYRGLICRTFGLITENSEGKLTIPYCAGEGLNYSKVYNPNTERISEDDVKKLGYKVMPKAYNLSRQHIETLSIAKKLELNWGESLMLLEWILPYIE